MGLKNFRGIDRISFVKNNETLRTIQNHVKDRTLNLESKQKMDYLLLVIHKIHKILTMNRSSAGAGAVHRSIRVSHNIFFVNV